AGKICDERRFAGSSATNDIGMVPPVGVLDAKALVLIAEIGFSEARNFLHPFSVEIASSARKQGKGSIRGNFGTLNPVVDGLHELCELHTRLHGRLCLSIKPGQRMR